MPTYTNSSSFRLQQHDLLETLFCGGHADDVNSSTTSLHLDAGQPNIRVENGKVHVYNGDSHAYELKKISDLKTDDRVYASSGHVKLSSNVVLLYKTLTEALNDGLFRLQGAFDCANTYVRGKVSRSTYGDLPIVTSDKYFPYFFQHSSPIAGYIKYRKSLPFANGEQRCVTCIDVKKTGGEDLNATIGNGEVVYLGGDHGVQQIAASEEKTSPNEQHVGKRRKSSRYAIYREERPAYEKNNDGHPADCRIQISSPFPNTWCANGFGPNVVVGKQCNGHYLCSGTWDEPEDGLPLFKYPLDKVPFGCSGIPKEYAVWPLDEDDETPLDTIFEGAWIIHGTRLSQDVDGCDCPQDVLDRFRGGFFHMGDREIDTHVTYIYSKMLKAMQSIEKYGPKMFGFSEKVGGAIACDIESVAAFIHLSEEVMLAFIAQFASRGTFFRGTMNFLGAEGEGMLDIRKPLPLGPWMKGSVADTGTGLLFVDATQKYFSVDTRVGVSWVTEYTGPGITKPTKLRLGSFIASP